MAEGCGARCVVLGPSLGRIGLVQRRAPDADLGHRAFARWRRR